MTEEKPLSRQELILRIVELVEASAKFPEERYYTQDDSPLGRSRHLRLARRGAIPAFKVGRTVYMKCDDVHAYIEAHPVEPSCPGPDGPTKAKAPPRNPLQLVKGL